MASTVTAPRLLARTNNSVVHRESMTFGGDTHAVVVKRSHADTDPGEFRREKNALSALKHPGIAPLVFADSSLTTLAIKEIDGQPISEVVKYTGPLETVHVTGVLSSLAATLAFMHQGQGSRPPYVHYDLSDTNVLWGRPGPTLIDFGKAFPLCDIPPEYYELEVGSPLYMSPEKLEKRPDLGRESDVFGLGVLGYYMMAGDYPFTPQAGCLRRQIMACDPLPVASRDTPLTRLIHACLERDPNNRPSALQVHEELQAV